MSAQKDSVRSAMNSTNVSLKRNVFTDPVEIDVYANIENYTPCRSLAAVVLIGLVGNTLSLTYLSKKKFRGRSYSIYFISLVISDNVYLIGTGLPVILEWAFHQSWRPNNSSDICIALHCILECSENLSSMLMLAIATDRFIAVVHPFRRPVMCTPKRALLTTLGLVILSILVTLPDLILLILGLTNSDCKVTVESILDLIEKNRFIIFSLVLPVAVTLYLNFRVLFAIKKARKLRHFYLENARNTATMSSGQIRITVALITVTIVSALMLLPVVALEIWEYCVLRLAETDAERKDILTNATCGSRLIEDLNVSINFFTLMFIMGFKGCCMCEIRSLGDNVMYRLRTNSLAIIRLRPTRRQTA